MYISHYIYQRVYVDVFLYLRTFVCWFLYVYVFWNVRLHLIQIFLFNMDRLECENICKVSAFENRQIDRKTYTFTFIRALSCNNTHLGIHKSLSLSLSLYIYIYIYMYIYIYIYRERESG